MEVPGRGRVDHRAAGLIGGNMFDVYVYREDETLVYHMTTTVEVAALIAAFRGFTGWSSLEVIAPGGASAVYYPA